MKPTILCSPLVLVSGLLATTAWAQVGPMSLRQETYLGCEPAPPGAYPETCIDPPALDDTSSATTAGTEFVPVPRLRTKFLTTEDHSVAAITLSAGEVLNESKNHLSARSPVWVRLLIDGEVASPGPVSLRFADLRGSAAFTFVAQDLDAGLHIAVVEWRVEDDPDVLEGPIALMRSASLVVKTGRSEARRADFVGLQVFADAPDEADVLAAGADSKDLQPIPGAVIPFYMPADGVGAATFSGEIRSEPNAIFDLGIEVFDRSDTVVYTQELRPFAYFAPVPHVETGDVEGYEARSWTFPIQGLGAGWYYARFLWRARLFVANSPGGEIRLRGRTVVIATASNAGSGAKLQVVAPKEPSSPVDAGEDWQPIPDLSTLVQAPPNAQIALTLDVDVVSGSNNLLARPTLDGKALPDGEVVLTQSGNGAFSYTWVLKHLSRRTPYVIGVDWRVMGNGGAATVGPRHLMLAIEEGPVPDLGEGANFASGSNLGTRRPIEPRHGASKVLFVVFDPGNSDNPVPDFDFMFQLEDDVISGGDPSADGLLQAMSGGRVQLDIVGVLGAYGGSQGGGDNSANHYWDPAAHTCSGDDPYVSPWDHQKAEALLAAEEELDFAAFDANRDGVLAPSELGIVIVTPQTTGTGSNVANFRPLCGGEEFTVDGVRIPRLLHWYTPSGGADGSSRAASAATLGHELTHLLLGLDDLYDDQTPPDKAGSGVHRIINTSLHGISLSASSGSPIHLDGVQKLHLGWVTPRTAQSPGAYVLTNVRKSREVLVLPRRNGTGREYFLLEARFDDGDLDSGNYDIGLGQNGLAIYHVIEPDDAACAAGDAPGCQTLAVPFCVQPAAWWTAFANNFARGGIRLIQPDLAHLFSSVDGPELTNTIWASGSIDDKGPAFACPALVGDALPPGGEPRVLWADGTASGYALADIAVVGDEVSFGLHIFE